MNDKRKRFRRHGVTARVVTTQVVTAGKDVDLRSLLSARYQLAELRENQPQDIVIFQALR
ncbi:MAG: hypothetical protein V3W41_16100 [Planctomycetota bacterium]